MLGISLRSLLSARGTRATLIRGSLAGLAARVAAILSGLLSTVILARVLDPSGYGTYSYAFAIIAVIMIPVRLGLPTLILRETARANAAKDWSLLRGIWRWSGCAISGGAVLAVCGVIVWLAAVGREMGAAERNTLLWGLPLIPLMALSAARASALSGLRLPVRSHLTDQVLRPVALSVLLLAALGLGIAVDPSRAMMFHSVAAMLAFSTGVALLAKARPAPMRVLGPHRMKHRDWARALLPLSALAAVQVVNQSADLIMLGIFRTDAEVGLYRIAVSSASIAAIGLTAMGMVLNGHIAHSLAQKDRARLQRILSAAALACTVATALILAGFLLMGKPMIGLIFGVNYTGAYPVLIVLTVAQLVSAFFGMNMNVLNMAGLEQRTLAASAISIGINIVLNLMLIPQFGVVGAGIATLISTTLLNFLCWSSVRNNLGLDSTLLSMNSSVPNKT
ncbi:lipopolysaccharide biosynthesis protein [Oceaniovalibus sp. ACAM 378]|uniref:lipopolysaccharide biosynthesis protein n=1 Tax=Oceaniovalibus sp. ACAM 378 TaxID=2599923 RepID=UPI0011D85208|nr:polysaccharide biosynthesis C-terminal domain-containing protein [Oceaniovalibus sp. ACAM 378]TYB85234.1 oligosaccharide flippase family protein [Oceaniovalibus sp. ACAM 378]